MKYTTRFGKIIDIPLDRYLSMSDDELAKLEEEQGTSLFPQDPLYMSLGTPIHFNVDDILHEEE